MKKSKSLSKKALTSRKISKGVTNYYAKNAGYRDKSARLRTVNRKEDAVNSC